MGYNENESGGITVSFSEYFDRTCTNSYLLYPRGVLNYQLGSLNEEIEWKVTGNLGGEQVRPVQFCSLSGSTSSSLKSSTKTNGVDLLMKAVSMPSEWVCHAYIKVEIY